MLAPSLLIFSTFTLLAAAVLAVSAVPQLVNPLEVSASAPVPFPNVTFGATPWPPAPFEWRVRGINQYLPIIRSVSITCERYDPWQFPADYIGAFSAITQHFVDQMRRTGKAYLLLPETMFGLQEAVEGIDVEVTVFNEPIRPGKRHTFLSVAETLMAFNKMIVTAETAHFAALVPRFREMPWITRKTYRPIHIHRALRVRVA